MHMVNFTHFYVCYQRISLFVCITCSHWWVAAISVLKALN